MPTTYTNGLKLPDLGSIDWYNSYKNNIDILDPIVGTVNGVATTYAPISHNHSASEITSGTIDIARLPPAALERMHIVADQTARYALTTSTVQEGDTVKQTDTGVMYLVVDSTKLNSADGYTEYSAGTASKAIADEDGTNIKSGYVNIAGNQTVTGNKKFTGSNTFNGIKSTGVIRVEKSTGDTEFEIVNGEVDATTNTLSRQDDIRFYDKNTKITGGLRLTYTTDTGTKIELYARSWKADGTASYNRSLTIYTNGQTGEYYTTLETNFLPKNTSAYSLGSSSYQWSSVYAQSYYYNGTAWGLDKANVWTGTNTFQQNITYERTNFFHQAINPCYFLKDTELEKGSLPLTAHTAYAGYWQDKNSASLGYVRFVEYDTGRQTAEFRVGNLIKNGSLDPTGSTINCTVNLELQPSGEKSLIPEQTNDINLGTSTNQWKSVYSQTYYYNGTAWGLDQNNTWTGTNAFSNVTTMQERLTLAGDRNAYLTPMWAGSGSGLCLLTGDASKPVYLGNYVAAGNHYTYDSSKGYLRICVGEISTINTVTIEPFGTDTQLGTSTNKWKTLNGVNPGALSFPNLDAAVAIDTTGWNIAGALSNTYTPAVDGWLAIDIKDTATNSVFIYAQGLSGIKQYSASIYGNGSQGTGRLSLMMPAFANVQYAFIIKADSLSDISYVRLYPCLGNV